MENEQQSPIETAISIMGSASNFATALHVSAAAVGQWKSGERKVPVERCPEIEALINFRVSCEELRPDARWVRVPDSTWGHPKGRPLLDPSTSAREANDKKTADIPPATDHAKASPRNPKHRESPTHQRGDKPSNRKGR